MSSTLLLPHAHSFVKGPAVINTHTRGTLLKKKRVRKRKTIVTEGEPRPETLLKKKQQPETRRERRTLLKEKQQWERPCWKRVTLFSSHHPLSLNSWPPTTPPHRTCSLWTNTIMTADTTFFTLRAYCSSLSMNLRWLPPHPTHTHVHTTYHTHVHTHIGGGFPGSQHKRR